MTEDERRGALLITQEWDVILAILANDTLDNLEIVKDLELKRPGHPFWLGKLSVIEFLRDLVQKDLERYGGKE